MWCAQLISVHSVISRQLHGPCACCICLSLCLAQHIRTGPKYERVKQTHANTMKRNLKSKQSPTIEKWCFYSLPVRINLNGRKMVTQEKYNQNSLCRDHLKDTQRPKWRKQRRSWNNGPNEHNSQRAPRHNEEASILFTIGTISDRSKIRSSVQSFFFFWYNTRIQRQKPCKSILAFESFFLLCLFPWSLLCTAYIFGA